MSKKQSISDFFSKVPKSSTLKQKSNDVFIASIDDHHMCDPAENLNPNKITTVELQTSPLASLSSQKEDITVIPSSSFSPSTKPSRGLDVNDMNMNSPSQPILAKYPKSKFGTRERSFSSLWYNKRPWLEYSEERDACFCFPCRVFGINVTSNTFTEGGYRDWKHALDSNTDTGKDKNKKLKGFAKHVASVQHSDNFSAWVDKQKRETSGNTISNVFHRVESDHQKWLHVIFHVIRYLAANGLPFRGDDEYLDLDEELSGGLFLNTLQNLVFEIQPDIARLARKIPKNAKYLSSDIQNELIAILTNMVREQHAIKIRSAELYTIMVDGTTDKNNEEVQGLVVRFFSLDTAEIEERLLNIGSSGRSAKGIFQFVRKTLDESEISFDGMVSQAFDGASVMSGHHSGLQALICKFCGRNVVYIHCFCHRLHLVVTAVMNNIEELKDHFGTVSGLYKFFKLAAVKEEYSGGALKRLIETRWSGHFVSCKAINDNYTEIMKTLPLATKNKKLDSSERAKAYGFQIQANKDEFIFLNHFIVDVLRICDIANKILQSSKENLNSAITSIDCVRDELKEKRSEYSNEEIARIINEVKSRQKDSTSPPASRSRKVPRRLDDFLVTEQLPVHEDTDLRRISIEALDRLEEEFSRRFSPVNTALWSSMECLLPSSENFMDKQLLEPLFRYAMEIPSVKDKISADSLNEQDFVAECRIYKRILCKQDRSTFKNENREALDMNKICAFMVKHHANNAPILTSLYRVAVTAGYASARVECVFSALTKVDSAQRRRMTTARESNLTFLHFERKALMALRFDDFLKIWREKPRKLLFD